MFNRFLKGVLTVGFLLNVSLCVQAQTAINLEEWGISPSNGKNIGPILRKLLEKHRDNAPISLNFAKGRYDFWPDTAGNNININGFELQDLKNIVINGNGSEFIFHGKMRPFLIRQSSNVRLKNFSIDWDRPFISQGEIIHIGKGFLDLRIDSAKYPYLMKNGKLTFIGEGWESRLTSDFNNLHTLYDKETKEIVYRTRDNPLGNIFLGKAEIIAKNTIRFFGKPALKPEPGTYVTLYHGRYILPGIEISHSKNSIIENVTVYHALSHGILGEMSENISVIRSSMTINEKKDRVFSIVADASHFTNCRGKIIVDGCTHSGMGDDFINVHGIYVKVLKRLDDKKIEVAASGRSAFRLTAVGDELYFVDSLTMKRTAYGSLQRIDTIKNGQSTKSYVLSFKHNIPVSVKAGYYLENRTWSASLELRNCKILKKHRARGILVTTPKNVIIENNYFNTAGAAILIEGDLNYWFESGGNENVIIRHNIFENCLTSGPEWGEAIITITPSLKKYNSTPYHRNISIENNIFKHFDTAILYARAVKNLSFKKNQLLKTDNYVPFSKHPTFFFNRCKAISINVNKRDKPFSATDIHTENMNKADLKTDW